ncbi:MAG: putative ABC transporter permease [Acetatifactor sp.]|nr:putative ABC transporter permease [Acetatifactor sp.]MDE6701604.1 putative ABC transporter permease [Acetatifactor sp.]MDE7112850.1 putative ABC transporter permease [Acetatifactor sp.]
MFRHKSPVHNPVKNFIHNFLLCGLTGWCLEITFTAMSSLRRRNLRLTGTTSLWMFPIYGCAALLHPLFKLMHKRPLFMRGLTYMTLIFSVEFLSGRFLRKRKLCPWDYARSRYNIGRVIRLDYAPFWFSAGLLFEHMLCRTQLQDETIQISSRTNP